jgi:hypothetical protein
MTSTMEMDESGTTASITSNSFYNSIKPQPQFAASFSEETSEINSLSHFSHRVTLIANALEHIRVSNIIRDQTDLNAILRANRALGSIDDQ